MLSISIPPPSQKSERELVTFLLETDLSTGSVHITFRSKICLQYSFPNTPILIFFPYSKHIPSPTTSLLSKILHKATTVTVPSITIRFHPHHSVPVHCSTLTQAIVFPVKQHHFPSLDSLSPLDSFWCPHTPSPWLSGHYHCLPSRCSQSST